MWSFWALGASAAKVQSLSDRVRGLEAQARREEETMASYSEAHAELDRRVEKLESELDAVRQDRLEAYDLWWSAREGRNRALHVARRLRRRLRRTPGLGGAEEFS